MPIFPAFLPWKATGAAPKRPTQLTYKMAFPARLAFATLSAGPETIEFLLQIRRGVLLQNGQGF